MADFRVTPGAIDLHACLQETDLSYAQSIVDGTRAALLGGFVFLADGSGKFDSPDGDKELSIKHEIAGRDAWIPTGLYASSSPGNSNVGKLKEIAPLVLGLELSLSDGVSGDGKPYVIQDFNEVVRVWHEEAPKKPVIFTPGNGDLRDLIGLVAVDNKHPLHIRINKPKDAEVVSYYQNAVGAAPVTCGVTAAHLLLTSHDQMTRGNLAAVKPPLVSGEDAEKLMALLEEGKIDVLETGFTPRSLDAKIKAERDNENNYGLPGIRDILPILFYQVEKGRLSIERLIEATHDRPAEILGVKFDSTTEVKWDVSGREYVIGETSDNQAGSWTPYRGMYAIGRIRQAKIGNMPTLINGLPYRKHLQVVNTRDHNIF